MTMLEEGVHESQQTFQDTIPSSKRSPTSRTLPNISHLTRSLNTSANNSPPHTTGDGNNISQNNMEHLLTHYSEKMVDRVQTLLNERLKGGGM